MALAAQDFLQKFHSLEGTTVAQRRKNFFTLLHNDASLLKNSSEVLNEITINLNPTTFLEQLFQVEFLIYFRRRQELLQLLREGNDVFVSKITKQIWFFQESFNDIEANELVNEILPNMSFTVRMKVLRKLSRYLPGENFEKIFDAVVARYGIFIASHFITGCGPSKVREILREYPITLSSTQLRILHDKDPELIDFYFTVTGQTIHSVGNKSLVRFIFNNNPTLYEYLREKYSISMKFGRRITKKFVDKNKKDIIKMPYKFHHLNMKAVFRKLGKDSVTLFTNTLFSKVQKIDLYDWLYRSFSKRYHYSLFVKTFQTHHNIKFIDYPNLIDENLLSFIPNNSERAILAKVKVDEGNDDYIKYLLTDDSIPLLKEKINLTSNIYDRAKLIKYLIETCKINDDFNALLSVMKYFTFRHKNDDLNVHKQFINNIEDLFGFHKFNQEMWNCLNELLAIHMLKFDQSESTHEKIQTSPLLSINLGTSSKQKLSYLEFLFKNNQSIDELLVDYFGGDHHKFPKYSMYDKNFGKYILLFAINKVEAKDEQIFCCLLIEEIDKWNKCYQDDKLSFYDFSRLVNSFNNIIRNSQSVFRVIQKFRNKIFTTTENPYRNEYLEIYWNRFSFYGNIKDVPWFLKYDPLCFVNHCDVLFNASFTNESNQLRCWYIIKKFSHLQLDQKLIQSCLTKLSDDNSVEKKSKYIPCLSVLMKPADFAALADSYKPATKKLSLTKETDVRLYNLQCALAGNFRNTKSYEVLSSLLHYCAGDYFKDALRSLYSILYRTPEAMLPQYLNYLSKKAVSVRKHALFLTCELSTRAKVENMIKHLSKQEDVQSLQKHMFATTIKYFVKNPSDQFFELVTLNMLLISKADNESLKSISENYHSVPKKYRARYFQYSWDFLEKTLDANSTLLGLLRDLLRFVSAEVTKEIPLEFGIKIIQEHLMNKDRDLPSMNEFTFNFLANRDEKTVIFEAIFGILDKCADQTQVLKFCQDWYTIIMRSKATDMQYLQLFVDYFATKTTITHNFYDVIKIFFLKLKIQSEKLSVDDLAQKIVVFYQDIVAKCGLHVTLLFAREINSNLAFYTNAEVKANDFYYSMVKNFPVADVAVLVLAVISEPRYDSFDVFYKILSLIRDIDDLGVQINLRSKFNKYLNPEGCLKHLSTRMDAEMS